MSVYYDPKKTPQERLFRGLIFILAGLLIALFMALIGADVQAQETPPSIRAVQVGAMHRPLEFFKTSSSATRSLFFL